jgi:hypothetical protein
MPDFKQIIAAREKSKRIREYAAEFRCELNLERIAEFHPAQDQQGAPAVRAFVVKLPNRSKEAA